MGAIIQIRITEENIMSLSKPKKMFLATLFIALFTFIFNLGYQYILKDVKNIIDNNKILVKALESVENNNVQPIIQDEYHTYGAEALAKPYSASEFNYNYITTSYNEGYLDEITTFDTIIITYMLLPRCDKVCQPYSCTTKLFNADAWIRCTVL